MRRSSGLLRFSPRPTSSTVVRKYSWQGSIDYVENGAGRLETRDVEGNISGGRILVFNDPTTNQVRLIAAP